MRQLISVVLSLMLCCGLPAQVFQSGGTTSNSYTPQPVQTATATLTGTGTTNVINVSSEQGSLQGLTLIVSTGITGAGTSFLEIQVDGGTTTQYSISPISGNSGNTPVFASISSTNAGWIPCVWSGSQNTGAATNPPILSCFLGGGVQYKSSLRVGINTTVVWTTGAIQMGAIRAIKS